MKVPEQALDGIPLPLGLVVKINLHVFIQIAVSCDYTSIPVPL